MSKKQVMPFLTLATRNGKTVLEISFNDDDATLFPATKEGFKKAAAALAASGTDSWMCSSSIDFPNDYGLGEIDIRSMLSNLVTEIRGPVPVGWWVLVVNNNELMNYGKGADTIEPYDNEADAVDQAKFLSEANTDNQRIYICKVFTTGQIKYDEWDN